MARKTPLELDDVRALLAPLDLRPRRLTPLDAGTINSNFRVDSDGGPLFLRVNEGKARGDVRYEGALLWHLGTRRFATPQPLRRPDGTPWLALRDRAGRERLVTVFPWVAGRHVDGSAITPAHTEALGRLLAELHRAARDFPEARAGIYTLRHIARRVDGLRGDARVKEALPILDDELAWLAKERAPDAALPAGTIHGDLFPDNVLWSSDGRLLCALDFEQASRGRLAYDLAVAICAWCWSREREDFDDARARSLVAGYEARRPLEERERAALFAELRVASLRFTVTRLTDVELADVTDEERRRKDWRDYAARTARLRTAGPDRVARWVERS